MYIFKFADIGEGLHEGTVGEINVKVGDAVKEGDTLFTVETDKVTSEIPSPATGKIAKMLFNEGDVIHVGQVIFHIDDGTGDAPAEQVTKEEAPAKESGGEKAASVVGDLKVSNDLFSFDNLKSSKATSAPAPKAEATTPKSASTSSFDWKAIKPKGDGEAVDAVVIGAGPGGYLLAGMLGKAGLKTVCIEKKYAGGVCLNVGCIPTKTLLKTTKLINYGKHAAKYGISVDPSNITYDWKAMQERKTTVSSTLEKGVEGLLKMNKVEFIKGAAKIIDRYNVKVKSRVFTTKLIIIATGSSPRNLPVKGFDEGIKAGIVIDSTGALALKKVPKTLTIIGGGVIGLEFATIYNELGTKVTILEGGPSILGPMDGEVKKLVIKKLKDTGIAVETEVKINKLEKDLVHYTSKDGKDKKVKSEKVLVSIGRTPNNLSIDKTTDVKIGSRGEIEVNEHLQTSVDNIFAIGDVVGQAMLAHTAYAHARVVNSFLLEDAKVKYNKHRVPGCVYTYPEISSIGKTEEQLKAEGIAYGKSVWQNQSLGKALADGSTDGFVKLLFDKEFGILLGAHIINDTSSDMIGELALLMELEGTIWELANTIHPHPSTSEGIWEAAMHGLSQLKK